MASGWSAVVPNGASLAHECASGFICCRAGSNPMSVRRWFPIQVSSTAPSHGLFIKSLHLSFGKAFDQTLVKINNPLVARTMGSTSPTSRPGSPRHPVDEPPKWEQRKTIIAELYEENELKDVMQVRKNDHRESQYKKQISRWGFNRKYVRGVEYKAIIRKKRKRKKEGENTECLLRSRRISDKNIVPFEERMISSKKISEEDTFSDIQTPHSLSCHTPIPLDGGSTTLQIPLRLCPQQRTAAVEFPKPTFFASFTSSEPDVTPHADDSSESAPKASYYPIQSAPLDGQLLDYLNKGMTSKSSPHLKVTHSTILHNSRPGMPSTVACFAGLQVRTPLIYKSQNIPSTEVQSSTPTPKPPCSMIELQHLSEQALVEEIFYISQEAGIVNRDIPLDSDIPEASDVISAASLCSECNSNPGDCTLRQRLSVMVHHSQTGKLSLSEAQELSGTYVRTLATARSHSLICLVHIAVDLVWILATSGRRHIVSKLATNLLQLPSNLFDAGQCSQRILLASSALTLAQQTKCKEALSLIKTALGASYEDILEVSLRVSSQQLDSSVLTFERAVIELTSGRIREIGWQLFDCDSSNGLGNVETWYRTSSGELRREEVTVRGVALQAVVEVEYQRRQQIILV
ncbi:uncharacterized protein BDR25DRAFT_341052 [Lindgomyces ingoldianus]|uniref:Uncharacterized protein n=1 Tax=Lindgomyces ingoldianus TaxID=673940 RepID=A0ACB6R383_9PLEO|nr:uncharacterized protein BDR25DRAFT_341052 [Lindgomyces ingoldianus]KAF2473779.1 hypothetical protein BDR25DRAFT_341052 [Lindgomyces ingoldianus]